MSLYISGSLAANMTVYRHNLQGTFFILKGTSTTRWLSSQTSFTFNSFGFIERSTTHEKIKREESKGTEGNCSPIDVLWTPKNKEEKLDASCWARNQLDTKQKHESQLDYIHSAGWFFAILFCEDFRLHSGSVLKDLWYGWSTCLWISLQSLPPDKTVDLPLRLSPKIARN